METEENVTVGGFHGTCAFTVVNACKAAISKVRITHFLKGKDEPTEYFIQENMASGENVPNVNFTSQSGKNDNWTISFQREGTGYMCGKLDKSMQENRSDYELVISEAKFTFRYSKDTTKWADKDVKSVYEIIG